MADSDAAEPPRLSGWPGRPYRLPVPADAEPEAVIADLVPADHPGALWGDWFGGGVLLFRAPLRLHEPVRAADGFAELADQPTLAWTDPDLVGGGWLIALGYAPGATTIAFYDSLLRWRPIEGWSFESLGLRGREGADAMALAGWRRMLAEAREPAAPGLLTTAFHLAADVASSRMGYLGVVEEVIGRIHRGDFYQMNLCIRLHARLGSPPPVVFAQVAAQLRPAYAGLVSGPSADGAPRMVMSFSPELFLRVRGRQVTTAPIKGTAPRTAAGETLLRSSAKDAAENVMIVDLMRNDLSKVCQPGTVAVDELLGVKPHPGVWHLVSTVHGELIDGVGTVELLRATFPPGSVTGAPKLAAQQGIAQLEAESRGAYTGSLGLVSPSAGTDLSVIIRTFEAAGDRVELGVGGGITVDSVPIREWYECLHKAAPLVTAAGAGLARELADEPGPPDPAMVAAGVFESVLVAHGAVVRLAGHLARLDRSCRELFGLGLPDGLVARIREHLTGTDPGERSALRIAARPDQGSLTLEVTSRRLPRRTTRCSLVHALRPERSWRHKWVDRAALERAEQLTDPALPFFTQAGLVAETSRGNLFWQAATGQWCTPPLDEAVLPGVTRREVLDLLAERGRPVQIRPATMSDLHQAQGAFWTSSLSGAVAVDSVDGHRLPDCAAFAAELTELLGAGR
ncbi:MAG TPA: chorismate-binding protein [Propionibacteriaceae bacterium]|nr:chorismate-binding protein [Propionibacteriaceae bacterium]